MKGKKKKIKRVVDNHMMWQGDYDEEKKVIRINKKKSKKKSSVIDTIVHEEMHAEKPHMTEKQVDRAVPKKLTGMSGEEKKRMYAKYKSQQKTGKQFGYKKKF